MAHVKVDKTQLRETLYSRWRTTDRRLYDLQQVRAIRHLNPRAEFWVYDPILPVLAVKPLTSRARKSLEIPLPF